MYIYGYNILEVNNATFSRNKADFGGAIYTASLGGNTAGFDSCMFDGNRASDGGAVYLYTGIGVDVFTSCDFRGNIARKWLIHGYVGRVWTKFSTILLDRKSSKADSAFA